MGSKKPKLSPKTFEVKKIHIGNAPTKRQIPIPQVKPTITKFAFSLQFFNQIKYFQIGQQHPSWYISLIERLQELSSKKREAFIKDVVEKQNFRYHEINWSGEGVPIKRSDLNWVDEYYLKNEEEYPFVQFHVSQALGRVVGFWDENNIFQIVLLDPLHNIQPSKRFSYKVNDTHFMSCQMSSLLIDIKKIQAKIKEDSSCNTCIEISKIPTRSNMTNILITHLEDEYIEELEKVNLSIEEILKLGILSMPTNDPENSVN
jgi:hypothetical protein